MLLLVFFLAASVVCNIVMTLLLVRAARRLLQFDYIWEAAWVDVEENIEYLNSLMARDLFSNSPEIVTANNNLKLLRNRLNHTLEMSRDVSGRRRSMPTRPQRPVAA